MKNTKIIAFLTAVCLCLPLLAACANGGGETLNTRDTSSVDAETGTFQNADFDNEEFTFLVIQQKAFNKDYYGGNYIDADGLTGATIEDAVYKRNMAVEEKYNVQIIQRVEQSGYPSELLNTFYMSGDFFFDVIYG